jgi:hypothetical protein
MASLILVVTFSVPPADQITQKYPVHWAYILQFFHGFHVLPHHVLTSLPQPYHPPPHRTSNGSAFIWVKNSNLVLVWENHQNTGVSEKSSHLSREEAGGYAGSRRRRTSSSTSDLLQNYITSTQSSIEIALCLVNLWWCDWKSCRSLLSVYSVLHCGGCIRATSSIMDITAGGGDSNGVWENGMELSSFILHLGGSGTCFFVIFSLQFIHNSLYFNCCFLHFRYWRFDRLLIIY